METDCAHWYFSKAVLYTAFGVPIQSRNPIKRRLWKSPENAFTAAPVRGSAQRQRFLWLTAILSSTAVNAETV